MGCVLRPLLLGQGPARQGCCPGIRHSGKRGQHHHQQTVRLGHESHHAGTRPDQAGTNDIMVAGGMESMSNAPYVLEKKPAAVTAWATAKPRIMFLDGLEDAKTGRLMALSHKTLPTNTASAVKKWTRSPLNPCVARKVD